MGPVLLAATIVGLAMVFVTGGPGPVLEHPPRPAAVDSAAVSAAQSPPPTDVRPGGTPPADAAPEL